MPTTVPELIAYPFDATLSGGAGFETLTGGATADLILIGPDGALVYAGDGDDGVVGSVGADMIWVGKGDDTVFGGAGNDSIMGQKGNNLLFGGAGNDLLNSGDQASTLDGGEGDDLLVARLKNGGAHLLTGGSGKDRFIFDLPSQDRNVIVTVTDFEAGHDTFTVFGVDHHAFMNGGVEIQNGPGAVRMGLGLREAVQFDGQSIASLGLVYAFNGNDTMVGADAGDDVIGAGAGNDWVRGFGGNDIIDGAAGNDTLDGGDGNDTLAGGEGDDLLIGGTGQNRLDGGNGNDRLESGTGASDLFGGAGQDTLVADLSQGGAHHLSGGFDSDRFDIVNPSTSGNVIVTIRDFDLGFDSFSVFGVDDTVFMNSGIEIQNGPGAVRFGIGAAEAVEMTGMTSARLQLVYGFDGNDRIIGWDAGDVLRGGAGNDQIIGHGGNDTIAGGYGRDVILGCDGNDLLSGNQGDDTIRGGVGNDSIHGNRGNNVLYGDAGDDLITSGDDSSLLYGGDGDDMLVARMKRGGVHVLEGGAGADSFDIVLTGGNAKPGQMVIADFELGVDSALVEGVSLGSYLTTHAPLIEDTPWGAWVTLDTGEIIKFNGLTVADVLLIG